MIISAPLKSIADLTIPEMRYMTVYDMIMDNYTGRECMHTKLNKLVLLSTTGYL